MTRKSMILRVANIIGRVVDALRSAIRDVFVRNISRRCLAAIELRASARIPIGMTNEIVVGMYDSRVDAEAARGRLIEKGVPAACIGIEAGSAVGDSPVPPGDRVAVRNVDEPLPEDRGVSGFIARMFSGALMDDANIEKYTEALRNGRCLVAVRVESDENRRIASAILAHGGPRIYSLPNASTAWNEASANDPASIGGIDDDPGRPEGLLGDAQGLPVQSDETRLANTPRKSRNR